MLEVLIGCISGLGEEGEMDLSFALPCQTLVNIYKKDEERLFKQAESDGTRGESLN